MEIGEPAAMPAVEGPTDEKKNDEKKICRFIARAKRPSGEGPWWSAGKLGGDGGSDDLTGHSFCAHEDEGGNRTWFGFYPKGAIVGWQNVPSEDHIAGALDFFKYVAGELFGGDAAHEYDDEKSYEITHDQYETANQFASKWKSEKTKYSLALKNCTTFVVKDGRQAHISIPSGGWAFANPASFGKNLAKSG